LLKKLTVEPAEIVKSPPNELPEIVTVVSPPTAASDGLAAVLAAALSA
jgi:hypothetical protein